MITRSDSEEALHEPLLKYATTDTGTAATRRRGRKAGNSKFVMVCIMSAVVLERLAYYSLLGNIVVFSNTVLDWSPEAALAVNLTFTGFTWFTCLLGGYFGDVVFGRMNTIAIGLIVYFTGFLCLPFLSWVVQDDNGSDGRSALNIVWFVVALSLVSLGEGCFKSNMSPFGADQLANDGNLDKFFSYFYWAINLGSLLGFGPVVFLQDKANFIYGYSLPAAMLLFALFIFLLPRSSGYIVNKPAPNITVKVCKILKEAWGRKRESRQPDLFASPNEYTGSGCYEDYVPIKHWLDKAMAKYGGTYLEIEVEEVKVLLNIIPVFSFLIIYCMLYYQVTSTFILQGMHMKVAMGNHFSVPVAWLGLANVIFVLVLVPLVRNGLFPCLEKHKILLTNAGKMSIGMFIATLALVAAGTVETFRREVTCTQVNNTISGMTVVGCDMSIFWQIPQFGLMAVSEIFVLITGLEFAYCQAPKKMQSIVTGLFFIANGLGSMFASLVLEFFSLGFKNKFVYEENSGHVRKHIGNLKGELRFFFYGLAALNFVNMLLFRRYAARSRAKNDNQTLQTVHEYIKSATAHGDPNVT